MIKSNPKYQIAFHSEVHKCDLYIPTQDTDYHLSRYIAAQAQNIYSNCGVTKDLLASFLGEMVKMCNDQTQVKTLRTDFAIMCNNLLYRTKYPVDDDCAIRMGAIYTFLEDENPDDVNDIWTRKKVEMCKGAGADAALYDFFLSMGIKSTPAWSEFVHHLSDTDYFKNREEELRKLMPQPID